NLVPGYVTGFVGRINGPGVGLRYNFNENSAIKFQFDRIWLRDLPTANVVNTQIAFSFYPGKAAGAPHASKAASARSHTMRWRSFLSRTFFRSSSSSGSSRSKVMLAGWNPFTSA